LLISMNASMCVAAPVDCSDEDHDQNDEVADVRFFLLFAEIVGFFLDTFVPTEIERVIVLFRLGHVNDD
jgi:hypothetical protein